MVAINLCVFIAVLPIVLIACQKAGAFINGVVFAFFYGFIGIFAAGHGLTNIYPITAGLGLINYQSDEVLEFNKLVSLVVLVCMLLISFALVFFAKDRVGSKKVKMIK